jgi:pimeloyl-[acyl-carrier protein] methyl ester esterase
MERSPLNWILIRGLSRETRHWGLFPAKLQEKFPDSFIRVLELPGVGTRHLETSPSSIEDFANALRPQLMELKQQYPGRWGIIAVSLGGMIAMKWAENYPDDFDCLITINSSAGNLSSPLDRLGPRAVGKIAKLFFKNDLEERERVILELTTRMTEITPELVRKWASFGKEYPLKRSVFLKQLYAASRFQVPEQLTLPYLIICGEGDRLTSPRCSKTLARHFDLPYISHPKAGHDIPLDDPDWLAQQVHDWILKSNYQRS